MSDRTDMLKRATCLPGTPPPLSMLNRSLALVATFEDGRVPRNGSELPSPVAALTHLKPRRTH
jgi:hypothetical protein